MNIRYSKEINKLTGYFYERTKDRNVNLSQEILLQIKDTTNILSEIQVWPPSLESLTLEMTLVYNYITLSIMLGCRKAHLSELTVNSIVSKTFERVFDFAKKDRTQLSQCNAQFPTDTTVLEITQCIKDPITHFRMLSILPHILMLWSIYCLHRRQYGNIKPTNHALQILIKLTEVVDQSVLKEPVQLKHDLLLCEIKSDTPDCQSSCPSVNDLIRLVLAGCKSQQTDVTLDYVKWEWLRTLLYCEDLMKHKKYLETLTMLEKILTSCLEPEQKSELLCLSAKCYFLQGFNQMAVKMYQEALMIYKKNIYILLHLAEVYQTLNLEAAELETLTLLIKVLKQKDKKPSDCTLMTGLDVMVATVCQVTPEVSLPSAYYAMALCCSRQKRHKESTQHYLPLLKELENPRIYSWKSCLPIEFDISIVLAETAEQMVLADQYLECISFCDKYYPCWSTDESLSKMFSQTSPNAADIWDLAENSQQSLFSDSQDQGSAPSCDEPSHCKGAEDEEQCVGNSSCSHNICQIMRKRLRSASLAVEPETDKTAEELFLRLRVLTRLLLSKADALFGTLGASEDTVQCLLKAYSLLMNPELNVFTTHDDISLQQPSLKRRRLDNDGNSCDGTGTIRDKDVSAEWTELVVTTALRLAQVSWRRQQYLSAQNSCSVVLQLDPRNIYAHYLRSVLSREQKQQTVERTKQWLEERKITYGSREDINVIICEKQMELQKHLKETSQKHWWLLSSAQLLTMDIECLNEMKSELSR